MKKLHWILAVIGLGFVLAAGWGYDYQRRHSEDALMARAHEYWEALRVNDLQTAFGFEAEALSGSLLPHEIQKRPDWGIRLVGFKFGEVTYYANHAEIEVTREMTWPDSKTNKTRIKPPIKDLWTFTRGEWYHGSTDKGSSSMRKSRGD